MGTSPSDEVWMQQMQRAEDILVELSGCKVERGFIEIDMEDPKIKKPLKVRYYVVGEEEEGKKTLVWCHGFFAAGCLYANMWKDLSK